MEELIKRAAIALGIGIHEHEVAKNFERSDFSAEEIYLAIQAAKILCNDRRTR